LHLTEPSSHHFAGDMHPGDPHLVADYSQHGFPKTAAHFGLVGISAFLLELNLFFFVTMH